MSQGWPDAPGAARDRPIGAFDKVQDGLKLFAATATG